jgi:hypothetical protein
MGVRIDFFAERDAGRVGVRAGVLDDSGRALPFGSAADSRVEDRRVDCGPSSSVNVEFSAGTMGDFSGTSGYGEASSVGVGAVAALFAGRPRCVPVCKGVRAIPPAWNADGTSSSSMGAARRLVELLGGWAAGLAATTAGERTGECRRE